MRRRPLRASWFAPSRFPVVCSHRAHSEGGSVVDRPLELSLRHLRAARHTLMARLLVELLFRPPSRPFVRSEAATAVRRNVVDGCRARPARSPRLWPALCSPCAPRSPKQVFLSRLDPRDSLSHVRTDVHVWRSMPVVALNLLLTRPPGAACCSFVARSFHRVPGPPFPKPNRTVTEFWGLLPSASCVSPRIRMMRRDAGISRNSPRRRLSVS